LAGRAWKFKDDVDTDAIIPGRYLVINDPEGLARYVFEGVRPEFAGGRSPATSWWREETSAAAPPGSTPPSASKARG
jgi:hypothetical protein